MRHRRKKNGTARGAACGRGYISVMENKKRKWIHKDAAAGQWFELSFNEQMGNIGSEVGQARLSQGKDEQLFRGAVERALELFDLSLMDSRWRSPLGQASGRLREINRAREVFCDAAFNEGREYKTSLTDLDNYFFHFAYAARNQLDKADG